jgi:hypothetical protein
MSVLFHDVHRELEGKLEGGFVDLIDLMQIIYADDTLLVGKRAKEFNLMLKAIEKHSKRYGMRLNKGKCVSLEMNTKVDVRFSDGTSLKKVTEAVYVGAKLTKKHFTRTEVENRLSKALETVRKLRDFFKKSQCSNSWKIMIYNAVVVSKLVYGLESLELVDSLKTRLDAFQIRGLRHILKIDHAYWSHTTNKEILERANFIAHKFDRPDGSVHEWHEFLQSSDAESRKIRLISTMLETRKERLLGHVIRSGCTDPLYQVSFDSEGARLEHEVRRVGRPRNNWIEKCSEKAYLRYIGDEFVRTDEEHRLRLFCAAFERMF